MKRIYILMCLGVVLLFSSCGFSQVKKGQITYLEPVDSLCSIIGLPTIMKLFDGKLFLVDMFSGDSLISVFDIKTKNSLISFGRKGNGPEEFLHISNIDFYRNKENQIELLVFDSMRRKCISYNYSELLKNRILEGICMNIDKSIPNLYELYKIDNGYIATGRIEKCKYVKLSDSLKVIDFMGDYRPKPFKSVPNDLHRLANYGKTEFSLDKRRMAEIVYKASVLSLYDINLNNITQRWEYKIDELDYNVVDGSVVNNSVMGYLSAYVGNNYVYALYSGVPENINEIATYGNEIHIFDNEGNMVDRIKIEKSAFSLVVDESEGKIFTLCHIPETIVLIYDYKR